MSPPPPLPLDSPRWRALDPAYGPATDVPEAYAAVPHVVAIAARRPRREQLHFWIFAGAVAATRPAPPVPPDLADAYEAALDRASALAPASFERRMGVSEATWRVVAVAGLRRQPAIAQAVECLIDGELVPSCPHCGSEVYITTTAWPFVVHAEDAGRDDGGGPAYVTAAHPRAPIDVLAALVRAAHLDDLAARLLALDARVRCPCGGAFELLDAFAAADHRRAICRTLPPRNHGRALTIDAP